MKTCEIEWIDSNGVPTPDQNAAVATIRCLFTGLPGPKREPSKPYACCADHMAQMPTDGSWEVVERFISKETEARSYRR